MAGDVVRAKANYLVSLCDRNGETLKTEETREQSSVSFSYRMLHTVARIGSSLYFRVTYSGIEHFPLHGAAILASNHESYFDPFLVTAPLRRKVIWLTLHRPNQRAIRSLLDRVGCIPVTGPRSVPGLKATLSRLAAGEVIGAFPEGTRTSNGAVGDFTPMIAMLAARSGAPVIPVRITGAYRLYNRFRKLPRMGRITVRFGPPLVYRNSGDDRRARYQDFARIVRAAVVAP